MNPLYWISLTVTSLVSIIALSTFLLNVYKNWHKRHTGKRTKEIWDRVFVGSICAIFAAIWLSKK